MGIYDEDINPDEDFSIDEHALHLENARQAELYRKYSRMSADAKRVVSQLKEKEKVLRSQLILKARDKKVRGKSVSTNAAGDEAYFRTHPKHKLIKKKILNAEYAANILEGDVWAMGHKKAGLANLTTLWVSNYNSEPRGRDTGSKKFYRDLDEMRNNETRNSIGTRKTRKRKKK